MAEKKLTAAEKKAAEEAAAEKAANERKRLIGAGVVLAAIALFAGGYAIGNTSDDDGYVGADVIFDEGRFPRGFPEDFEFPEWFDFDHRGGFDFDFGDDFPGPGGGFDFEFDFPGQRDGGLGFGFDCYPSEVVPGGFHCEFRLPGEFGFPGQGFPFGDEQPPDVAPLVEPGFLGVSVVDNAGVTVVDVLSGSAADEAGIEIGDVIEAVDGQPVEMVDDLAGLITEAGAGTEVEVTVVRDGDEITFDVVLMAAPVG